MSGICPICHKKAPARPRNAAWPFCGERCKSIDLAKWLGGEYRIATNEQPDGTSNENPPAAGTPKEMPS